MMSIKLKTTGLLAVCLLLSAGIQAQQSDTVEPALGRYSPVSYFEHDGPRLGSSEFTAIHDGTVYYFTSLEQLDRFREDPERYTPLFPHHCPYNLALGRAAAIDPTNFRIVAGQLLIFHRSEEMDGLQKWDSHDADEQNELLERARGNFKLLRF